MVDRFTAEDDELLEALGVEVEVKKQASLSAEQERVVAGFEEIQRFYEQHGRAPTHSESGDIFERLYAVRLDRLRRLTAHHDLLKPLDHQGLLSDTAPVKVEADSLDDDELLAQLGVEIEKSDLTTLKHVRSSAD